MERRDLYEVLGVERGQPSDEIKQAYRRLAREHHPDVNPDDAEAEARFKEISFAKEVLLDDERRKLYDEFGFDGLAAGFDAEQARSYRDWSQRAAHGSGDGFASQADLDDFLAQMFGTTSFDGDSRGGRRTWRFSEHPRPGADLESELEIDFLDAVRGGEIRMKLGADPGTAQRERTLRVKIPEGATDGTRIRLAGQGVSRSPGGPAGDLYIRLRVRPHPVYERRGNDLHMTLPVTLPELILGAEIDVPTPGGTVSMKVPAGSANGQKLRLRGRGVRRATGGAAGDLFVQLEAVMPKAGDERLDEIARELEGFYRGQPVREDLEREA